MFVEIAAFYVQPFYSYKTGFFKQWAIEDFAVCHKAIQKVGCLIQKSLISVISIEELTKIGDSVALTFFSEMKAEDRSLRSEDLFFSEDRAITGHKTLTQKPRPSFSRRRVTEL